MDTVKRFLIDVVIENVLIAMYHSYRFLNGRFGKKVLRKPYKQIWQIIAWSLFIYFFTTKIMFPIIEWWQRIVDCMNYVIWG